MRKRSLPRPTDAELEILSVLWTRGACTVREVYEEINGTKPTGYTTVLKLMQIMTEKGLVTRNEQERAHVYEAAMAREETQRQLIGELLNRAFDGSAASLVMQALSAKKSSRAELARIREMLDDLEGGAKR
jgi:predicted transcriptional regulator